MVPGKYLTSFLLSLAADVLAGGAAEQRCLDVCWTPYLDRSQPDGTPQGQVPLVRWSGPYQLSGNWQQGLHLLSITSDENAELCLQTMHKKQIEAYLATAFGQ